MKKLKLKTNAFNQGEVLTRAQMKKVKGGSEQFPCGKAGDFCSTITEAFCCQGLTCVGQKDFQPGTCL